MLTIIVVSFNSASMLIECQGELLASGRFPVIVIDNASTDGSADILATRFPQISIMRMDMNLGYGRAANRALAEVHTPYAFLLNPDLQADTENVEAMLGFAQAQAGNGSLFAPAVVAKDHQDCGAVSRDWVIGAALLFKMDAFSEIGFFDENIFLFSEETDLCRRLTTGGHKILLNTNVYIHHLKGQSTRPNPKIDALKNWHRGWSKMYYLHKHGLIRGWWAPRRICMKYLMKAVLATSAEKRQRYAVRAGGMWAYLRGQKAFMADGQPAT
ncbi:MAG: glycosyltransferase family 2 protein [Pseudomonadota bacterium]